MLRDIKDAPKQLYFRGNWDPSIFEACLAVVGTRRMTSYGKRVCEELVGEIASAGITIVSGFMYGIDAAAHKAALRVGGRTIAVMPCGIEIIHPEYQKDLYQEILEHGGIVVSEYKGSMLPTLWTYPRRNRIVAGLCQAALIVEAGEKSGSLITANFIKKYGRKLFAVPGPITSSVSQGTLLLLEQGAAIAKNAQIILTYYRSIIPSFSFFWQNKGANVLKKSDIEEKSKTEEHILEQLRREAMEIDALARILGISVAHLGATLSLMELNGLIFEEGGRYYVN